MCEQVQWIRYRREYIFYIWHCTACLLLAIGALAAINQQRLWTHSIENLVAVQCSSICNMYAYCSVWAFKAFEVSGMDTGSIFTISSKCTKLQGPSVQFCHLQKLIRTVGNFSVNSFSCFYDSCLPVFCRSYSQPLQPYECNSKLFPIQVSCSFLHGTNFHICFFSLSLSLSLSLASHWYESLNFSMFKFIGALHRSLSPKIDNSQRKRQIAKCKTNRSREQWKKNAMETKEQRIDCLIFRTRKC